MKKYVKIGFLWNYNAIRKGYVRIQCQTSDKIPYIIYVEIESLIKTIDGCANNSSTTKIVSIFFVDIQCQQIGHLIT